MPASVDDHLSNLGEGCRSWVLEVWMVCWLVSGSTCLEAGGLGG